MKKTINSVIFQKDFRKFIRLRPRFVDDDAARALALALATSAFATTSGRRFLDISFRLTVVVADVVAVVVNCVGFAFATVDVNLAV